MLATVDSHKNAANSVGFEVVVCAERGEGEVTVHYCCGFVKCRCWSNCVL